MLEVIYSHRDSGEKKKRKVNDLNMILALGHH